MSIGVRLGSVEVVGTGKVLEMFVGRLLWEVENLGKREVVGSGVVSECWSSVVGKWELLGVEAFNRL